MESAQNLTDLPPDTSCQITKYQRVTGILNPLWPGVKVSFTILEFIGFRFIQYCSAKLHTTVASPFLSLTCTFGALDFVSITMTILEKNGIQKTVNATPLFSMGSLDITGFDGP